MTVDLGHRSIHRDTESQLFILTEDPQLIQQLEKVPIDFSFVLSRPVTSQLATVILSLSSRLLSNHS